MTAAIVFLFIGLLVGVLIGAGASYILLAKKHQQIFSNSEKENAVLHEQINQLQSRFLVEQNLQEKKLENLTHELLQKGVSVIQDSSVKNLEVILKPFREKLSDFEQKVQRVYDVEAKERFSLKQQVDRMATASEGLSRALRGDFKTQGIWGELVLERILEVAGLREGIEYTLQAKEMGLASESGGRLKPDVVIHLPDEKHLIIDSKVTLAPFEKWINTDVAALEKETTFKAFMSAVKSHVSDLSGKHYQNAASLNSPDFVFLFLPIEAALVSLHEKDPSLFNWAWQKKVVIVGPSTLLPTLKTVESIWKNERQNQNALEIARLGGLLYDKFVSFCEDLVGVGKAIGQAQNAYDESLKKLSEGKGNLLRQGERLKELGVRSQKVQPKEMKALVESQVDDEKSPNEIEA